MNIFRTIIFGTRTLLGILLGYERQLRRERLQREVNIEALIKQYKEVRDDLENRYDNKSKNQTS